MNQQSPSRSPKRTTVRKTITVTKFSEHMVAQRENADLHQDLLKCQAQNEDLKNVLIGLDYKLQVFNDLKSDLQQHKDMLEKSEAARLGLQQDLQRTAV